jgi:23S rRNA G2069 N7-methylase RlmK/C1962 C5-methylase RlmI
MGYCSYGNRPLQQAVRLLEQSDLFQKIVASAALEAGMETRIDGCLHASADHPVALNFPEGKYLKGLLLWVGV